MHSLPIWTAAAQLLILGSKAQNSSNSAATCSDIEEAVQFNASTTRQIPALQFQVLGDNEEYIIVNDSSRTWDLSLRVTKLPRVNDSVPIDESRSVWQQTMFLDTKDSRMSNIGSCHQPLQVAGFDNKYEWTRELLERSLEDNGDCTTLLSNECLEALKDTNRIGTASMQKTGSCLQLNRTMPAECNSGFGTSLGIRQMNMTYFDGIEENNSNSRFNSSLECNGINASSTHTLDVAYRMSYENAVRFPVIDVIYFWPNRTNVTDGWEQTRQQDVRVEVVCMRPDAKIEDGSRTPPTGRELLGAEQAKFPKENDATTLRYGVLGWMSAAVMGVMLLL